jgi:hypothetical protein
VYLVGWGDFSKIKILILLILLSDVFAQTIDVPPWYIKNYDTQVKNIWEAYQPIALIAVLVSFTVASLLYGFGFILNNERLRNYGMAEFLESVASFLMVGFFIILLQILVHTFFPIAVSTPEQQQIVEVGPFAYLDAKLASIQRISNKTFILLTNVLYPLYFLSSIEITPAFEKITGGTVGKIQTGVPMARTVTNLFKMILNTFISIFADFADYMYSGLKALSFQRALLRFFAESALTTFLPLGVVLRIFPPTRGAGGMLIAMAFSFFFVFPFVYLVFYFPSTSSNLYSTLMSNLNEINKKLDELNSSPLLGSLKGITSSSALLGVIVTILSSLLLLGTEVIPIINLFISYFPTYFFVTSLIPVIAGAITLTFMATLSDLFGENALTYGNKLIGRIL